MCGCVHARVCAHVCKELNEKNQTHSLLGGSGTFLNPVCSEPWDLSVLPALRSSGEPKGMGCTVNRILPAVCWVHADSPFMVNWGFRQALVKTTGLCSSIIFLTISKSGFTISFLFVKSWMDFWDICLHFLKDHAGTYKVFYRERRHPFKSLI